jgi:uncharacterized short protein YbdD (DUF466 family)
MLSGWVERVRLAGAAARRAAQWLCEDRAYAAYLSHWQVHHASAGDRPLSRTEFFRQRTQRKWSGINRCC